MQPSKSEIQERLWGDLWDFVAADPCPRCNGDGEWLHIDGEEMRRARKAKGVGLRELAEKLHLSAAYLSDLELGRRQFSEDTARTYLVALGIL